MTTPFEKPPITVVHDIVTFSEENDCDSLMHYGRGHEDGGRSGRYPYGSGHNPLQRPGDFISRYEQAKSEGKTEAQIQEEFSMSSTDIKNMISICTNDRKIALHARVVKMKEEGMSNVAIGEVIGKPESTVRNMLKEDYEVKRSTARATADILKKCVDEKGMLDVGKSTEYSLKTSSSRVKQALLLLDEEGYNTYPVAFDQATNPGQRTRMLVLCKPGITQAQVYNNPGDIQNVVDYTSDDGGDTFRPTFVKPASISSSRVHVKRPSDNPDEDGNAEDGTIYIRPGVADLDLGESHYAQVRILVDGNRYMKGMALYGDFSNEPDGIDVIYNTHYTEEQKPGLKAFKSAKTDSAGNILENPFGSSIKPGIYDPETGENRDGGQSYYIDANGEKKLSAINKKAAEGDWETWSDKLPSQFLSKQPDALIRKQLDISKAERRAEFDEIMALENPVVKKQLLKDFAEACDTNAVSLSAAALPGQKYQVLLPVKTLKDDEFYCPRFKDGENVVLIRYPHGGTFEIAEGHINNKNQDARKLLGMAQDAIGVNKAVADKLSGADFDGDTTMVIPCNSGTSKVRINVKDTLAGLKGFDDKMEYGYSDKQIEQGELLADWTAASKKGQTKAEFAAEYKKGKYKDEENLDIALKEAKSSGVKLMRDTQKEMGVISNLITDMTIKGANEEELARAVRHSMVVIDAEKHNLDYKRSEIENDIDGLKKLYQAHVDPETGKTRYGASTLISRAGSEVSVDKRQGSGRIDKETGEVSYKTAYDLYYPDRKFDKQSGLVTVTLAEKLPNGRKQTITYNPKDKEQAALYDPIEKTNEDGTKYYENSKGQKYKTLKRSDVSTAMAEVKDARTLSAGYSQEELYADYANYLKGLANQARKEMVNQPHIQKNASAAEAFATEKEHLLAQLTASEMNQPKERKAQTLTQAELARYKADDPNMSGKQLSKLSLQLLTKYRAQVGAKSTRIDISEREWQAIQAGALTENQVSKILLRADGEQVRKYATPRKQNTISTGKQMKIDAMKASGHYTLAEIAESVGCSVTTVNKYLKGA